MKAATNPEWAGWGEESEFASQKLILGLWTKSCIPVGCMNMFMVRHFILYKLPSLFWMALLYLFLVQLVIANANLGDGPNFLGEHIFDKSEDPFSLFRWRNQQDVHIWTWVGIRYFFLARWTASLKVWTFKVMEKYFNSWWKKHIDVMWYPIFDVCLCSNVYKSWAFLTTDGEDLFI